MQIARFERRSASAEEYAAANRFWNQMRAERVPEDPPVPLEEDVRRWQTVPDFLVDESWAGWLADEIVAMGSASYLQTEENQHLVEFYIAVLPVHRQRGLGRQLLAQAVAVPLHEERRLMLTDTWGHIPGGAAFMQRLGAQMGLATHTNQLDLAELDRTLIALWQARAPERAAGFDVGFWTEGYPEEDMAEVTRVFETMNRAPRDALDVEDQHWTPEQIRQWDASDRARGTEKWTAYVREQATGRIAGMTEVAWHPNRPQIVNQYGTMVLPEYQNRGLGRWLKAAMLDKILRERPSVTRIRTGNADSNAPMLKINRELGFKPFRSHYVWQVETTAVVDYLRARGLRD